MCKRFVSILLLITALCVACIPAGAAPARRPSVATLVEHFAARRQPAPHRPSQPQPLPEGETGAVPHILPIYPGDTFEPVTLPLPAPYRLIPLH